MRVASKDKKENYVDCKDKKELNRIKYFKICFKAYF